jgi:hypothetical protein
MTGLPPIFRSVLILAITAMPAISHAIEEPDYVVLRTFDVVELRQYAAYVVAEVVLDSTAEDAGQQAFPILAGYIFGKNKGERKLAMTAPVTQSAAPAAETETAPAAMRMAMTAPVTQAAVSGGMVVQFVLPSGVTLASAPEPLDPRVKLKQLPASTRAVIRYSGSWSQANYQQHLTLLVAALAAEDLATQGEPVLARYNAPFTPWFLRRNEIWLALR